MAHGDERRIVVGDHHGSVRCQMVEDIVGVAAHAPQVKEVTDAALGEDGLGFGSAFEDEGMEAVAGEWIAAGEPFVNQQREIFAVGQIDRIFQRLIPARAPVHLHPVKNVLRIGTGRGGVERADSVFNHFYLDANSSHTK